MLTIQPMQWSRLPDIAHVPPLDESDLACMAEVKAVLERHGKLGRFALHLAQSHFPMADNEILVERQDESQRAHAVSVERIDQAGLIVPTTWLLMGDKPYAGCAINQRGDHSGRTTDTDSPGQAHQKEKAAEQERIQRDKARHEIGFPIAGHKPKGRGR